MARRPPTDPLSETLDNLGYRASLLRSLFSLRAIEREFLTRQQLSERLLDDFDEDREDIFKYQELYKALGILEQDDDLFDILLAMYSEGVLGFFDTEEERLYVVSEGDELDPQDQLTYIHEYVHALQQQHYDIDATFDELEENSDRSSAFRGLIEGDASVSELIYMFQHMDEQEQAEARAAPPDGSLEAFRAAPYVIQRTYTFPYVEGTRFVISLFTTNNDWELVDEAFTELPQSTEQVLHPQKYLAREAPVMVTLPDLATALGAGWSQLLTDTFGEFFIRAYLEMGVSTDRAELAATGWGGDRFSVLKSTEDETLLYSLIAWDAEDEAQEFFEAFLEFNEARTDSKWEEPGDDDTERLMVLSDQVIFLDWMGVDILLIFAPDSEALEAARSAGGM